MTTLSDSYDITYC